MTTERATRVYPRGAHDVDVVRFLVRCRGKTIEVPIGAGIVNNPRMTEAQLHALLREHARVLWRLSEAEAATAEIERLGD